MSSRFLRFFAVLSPSLAFALPAAAGSMDPALDRLVENPGCRTLDGAIQPDAAPCEPDQAAFARLVNQFGFALAPAALAPARTLGVMGFQVSLEGVFSRVDSNVLEVGTRGEAGRGRNTDPAGLLQVYSVRLRKGWGGGLELDGQFGFVPQTSWLSGGVDLRWALLEGFRTGTLGYVPDLSIGGGVRTTTGSAQMQITVVGADARLSKPFVIQDEAVVTPWLGFQYLWIFGRSGVIDTTPATNALAYCNPEGAGNGAPPVGVSGDRAGCTGSALDFENDVTFDDEVLHRSRLVLGTSYQHEIWVVSGQLLMDVASPSGAQVNGRRALALEGESRQWGFALDAGVRF